jgi:hypothetical protein
VPAATPTARPRLCSRENTEYYLEPQVRGHCAVHAYNNRCRLVNAPHVAVPGLQHRRRVCGGDTMLQRLVWSSTTGRTPARLPTGGRALYLTSAMAHRYRGDFTMDCHTRRSVPIRPLNIPLTVHNSRPPTTYTHFRPATFSRILLPTSARCTPNANHSES